MPEPDFAWSAFLRAPRARWLAIPLTLSCPFTFTRGPRDRAKAPVPRSPGPWFCLDAEGRDEGRGYLREVENVIAASR